VSHIDLLFKIRHSLAHVLAQAVLEIRPGSKLGFGPPIDDGFYYDFILSSPIGESDFHELENRMRRIIQAKADFIREEIPVDAALKRLGEMGEPYKAEFARELAEKRGETKISFYYSGGFRDMCDGPHVEHSSEIPLDCFKLRSVAGAYWRGDSSNAVMTRIYAWAFLNKAQLDEAIFAHEEAIKRDHRKLGKELELFHFDEEVGQGLPLWLPNGTVVRDELEKFIKEMEFLADYKRVSTPQIAHGALYERSGHLSHYAEGMFPPILISESSANEGKKKEPYYLRPMNCPHHHRIFASKPRSYRDLPLRLAEYGQIYRYEDSGSLAGIMRARSCCQNDAHIYCEKSQIKEEMISVLQMYSRAYQILGINEFRLRLSKWDPADPKKKDKYVDEPELWDWSQELLREILVEVKLPFFEADGEAAFYGPKIDVQFKTVSGREETASTIQLDFSSAKRMGLIYKGSDGGDHLPYIIHRAPLGSHERFVAFLIEKYAGAFPFWLAPVQVKILPVANTFADYAEKVNRLLRSVYIRSEVDSSLETLPKRVRNATLAKVPFVVVVGEREISGNNVAVRIRSEKQQVVIPMERFVEMLKKKSSLRELELTITQ
jgi:threonyl-tRNA synthetase